MIQSNEKVLKIVGVYFTSLIGINVFLDNGQRVIINFHPGYDWEEIKFSSVSYDEPAKETKNGTLYSQLLKLTLAGDEEILQERLAELNSCKPLLRVEYDNGISKIIGDKENYCKVLSNFSSEGFITKRELSLTRQSAQPALFLRT